MRERRLGFRVPLEVMMTSYVRDRPVRALTYDVSDAGIGVSAISMLAPSPGMIMSLELELPGVADSIWAKGEVCYQERGDIATGLGIRFLAMATQHARTVRDYCVEARRRHLGGLLSRIHGVS
ncbi:MAG: PilZ domain-containing protein [Kofleriaceae bacterium]